MCLRVYKTGGGRDVLEGGDMGIIMADSSCCMKETNITL